MYINDQSEQQPYCVVYIIYYFMNCRTYYITKVCGTAHHIFYVSNRKPPMVRYSYTQQTIILSRILNQKKVVQDFYTEDMHYDCSTCRYCYENVTGHVVKN